MRIPNAGTEAVTRVLTESEDENGEHWTTIGCRPILSMLRSRR
jgi:2-isopropylmalate synthase